MLSFASRCPSQSHNALGDESALEIARCLERNTTLTSLSLHGNQIGDRGVRALAHALEANSTLRSLFLTQNPISPHAIAALRAANDARATPMSGLCGLVLDG